MDCDRARSKHSCHPTSPYLLPTAAKTAARGGIKLDHDGRIARLCHLGVERPKSKRVESSLIISLRARDTARCQTGWNGKGNHMLTPQLTFGETRVATPAFAIAKLTILVSTPDSTRRAARIKRCSCTDEFRQREGTRCIIIVGHPKWMRS